MNVTDDPVAHRLRELADFIPRIHQRSSMPIWVARPRVRAVAGSNPATDARPEDKLRAMTVLGLMGRGYRPTKKIHWPRGRAAAGWAARGPPMVKCGEQH